ncbi:MAG TPA: hypothetical protein VKZ97_06105 [Flavobacteriaceae bacterium]|nr:hypothetical protein [Flavobacteriaceae bacterium]
MKRTHIHIIKTVLTLQMLVWSLFSYGESKDVYLVFYATYNGKSGHIGLAIDNYKVVVKDTLDLQQRPISVYDTIPDGTLTYFDLWPQTDDFNINNLDKNLPAVYYKLPAASWEKKITVKSLLKEGIPHEEHYPVDGLVRIKSTSIQDAKTKAFAEKLIHDNKPFNVRQYNCSDFVEQILEYHCQCSIEAEESIVFRNSTTPNRLYLETLKLKMVSIIKSAGDKAKGSFTMERLMKRNQ